MKRYDFSRNYVDLWSLLEGGCEVFCLVNYTQDQETVRDPAIAKLIEKTLIVGVRGTAYIWIPNVDFNLFRRACVENSLEFIAPTVFV